MDADQKPIDPESLRNIACWLDSYDAMAEQYFDLMERFGLLDTPKLVVSAKKAREACRGDQVQRDLRRWANEMETSS